MPALAIIYWKCHWSRATKFHFLLSSYPTLEVSPGSRDDINVQDSWRRCRNLRKGKCKSEEPHVLYSSVPPARMHFPHFNRLHKDHPETKPQTFPPRSKGRHQLRSLEESTLGFLQHMPGNISLNQTAAEKTERAGQSLGQPCCWQPPWLPMVEGPRLGNNVWQARQERDGRPGCGFLASSDQWVWAVKLKSEKSILLTYGWGF